MDKRPSDHIENRFRQAADNFLPPQNEEAWKRMEVLLDKDPDKSRPFIWWWMFGLLLLGLGTAGLYRYWVNTPAETSSLKERKAIVQTGNKPAGGYKRNIDLQKPAVAGVPENGLVEKGQEASQTTVKKSSEGDVRMPAGQPEQKGVPGLYKNSRIKKSSVWQRQQTGVNANGRNQLENNTRPQGKIKGNIREGGIGESSLETETAGLKATDVALLYQQPAYISGVGIPGPIPTHPDSRCLLPDSLQRAIDDAIRKAATQEPLPAKWYIIAAAGTNATSLQKFDTKNRGTVFGGSVGYYLNRFISIQAGFYAGRKIYFAGPTDYSPKPGSYWSNPNIKIMKVDADCYIFDLPLLVRVDVLQNRHNALYATAGFSSFITNKEDYVYHYNYSTSYQRKVASYKGNVDWFSSADFSIGFEQRLFKPFYLQIEPYAKLPLSGIGEGRVKLYSLGVQLGLKYQPLKQR